MKKWLLFAGILLAPVMVHAADSVVISTQTMGSRRATITMTNVSDGTGESAARKINLSGLTGAPTAVRIVNVWWATSGMDVRVYFDHTTDDLALTLTGYGNFDFSRFGGLKDPASAGGTGDILFTTVGHSSGDSYFAVFEVSY